MRTVEPLALRKVLVRLTEYGIKDEKGRTNEEGSKKQREEK